MLTYWLLNHREQLLVTFPSRYNNCHKKINLKTASTKWTLYCPCLDVLWGTINNLSHYEPIKNQDHYLPRLMIQCPIICLVVRSHHYGDVIMGPITSQITSLTIVYSTVYSDADQRKHQSSASLAFVWVIHRGSVNSPHKWPVTRKMFPFDDVIMIKPQRREVSTVYCQEYCHISKRPINSKYVYCGFMGLGESYDKTSDRARSLWCYYFPVDVEICSSIMTEWNPRECLLRGPFWWQYGVVFGCLADPGIVALYRWHIFHAN